RWAASDKPLLVGNEFLRFGPRKPAIQQGQEIDLVVRLGETAKKLPPEALAAVRIFRQPPGKAEDPVSLRARPHPESRPRDVETKLWRSWPTLFLFLTLLTLEWAGRKWAGLP